MANRDGAPDRPLSPPVHQRGTREDWERGWSHIAPIFGDLAPRTVTLEHVDAWYHALKVMKSVSEAHRAMKIWRALWNVAAAMHYCSADEDPSLGIRRETPKGRSATWEEGEVVSKKKELKLELETAEMDYRRLFDKYEESKKLAEQQFISKDELRSDEIRMVEAKARQEQARLAEEVYLEYDFRKEEAQKNSDVVQAIAERLRVEERHKAALETATTEVASKEYQLRSRQERPGRLDMLRGLRASRCQEPSQGVPQPVPAVCFFHSAKHAPPRAEDLGTT